MKDLLTSFCFFCVQWLFTIFYFISFSFFNLSLSLLFFFLFLDPPFLLFLLFQFSFSIPLLLFNSLLLFLSFLLLDFALTLFLLFLLPVFGGFNQILQLIISNLSSKIREATARTYPVYYTS